tara:strand:- start:427 stop:630 length:204 start_codon:yes stop_codon:yes gene_type:complete
MKEYILYGCKIGKEDWKEIILLTTYEPKDIEKVKPLATKEGYDRFRVATFEFGKDFPDFSNPKIINL